MKQRVFIALLVALMLPAVASAQLITTAQTITVKEKRVVEDGYKGYQQSIDVPIVTNFDDDGTNYVGVNYIGGYRFNDMFFLGAGIGINFNLFYHEYDGSSLYNDGSGHAWTFDNLVSVPLYAHARLYLRGAKCQPFFSLSIGGLLSGNREIEDLYDVTYNPSVFFINPAVGLNFRGKACDFYVTAGLLPHYKVDWIEFWNYGREMELERGWYCSMSINLGVTF
ncbi:MAG: hypothetical protein IKY13_08130 [Bacteroidaceae bacterium]|nr:hypothetical protein [Bacteroidaceae bacterium]